MKLVKRALLPFGLAALLLLAQPAAAQLGTPCGQRRTYIPEPWVDPAQVCLEQVIDSPEAGDLAYTALAVDAAGTLYAARPLHGQIIALDDSDGDGLVDAPRIFAEGLRRPNGLAWHQGALYVVGEGHLYRLQDGEAETLADDLPRGIAWPSAIAIGGERVYVAVSAPCDLCAPDANLTSGAIYSFTLDGADRRIEAVGLRQPGDLAVYQGALWFGDRAPDVHRTIADLDEINRLPLGEATAHFGFPLCLGAAQVDFTDAFCLTQTILPAFRLPTHSAPLGMAVYTGDAVPILRGSLLVALNGNRNDPLLRGFAVIALRFDADGQFIERYDLIPNGDAYRQIESFDQDQLNYRNSGFFPRRPIDVAVSPDGIVYLSISGGRILALRAP